LSKRRKAAEVVTVTSPTPETLSDEPVTKKIKIDVTDDMEVEKPAIEEELSLSKKRKK